MPTGQETIRETSLRDACAVGKRVRPRDSTRCARVSRLLALDAKCVPARRATDPPRPRSASARPSNGSRWFVQRNFQSSTARLGCAQINSTRADSKSRVHVGMRKRSKRMRFFSSYTSRTPRRSARAKRLDPTRTPLTRHSPRSRRSPRVPRAFPSPHVRPHRPTRRTPAAIPEIFHRLRHPRDIHPPPLSPPPPRVPPRPPRGTHPRAKRRTRDGFSPRLETRARFAPTSGAPGWRGSVFGSRVRGAAKEHERAATTTV